MRKSDKSDFRCHPRLYSEKLKTWMPGTRPGMTTQSSMHLRGRMVHHFRKAMDALYFVCVVIAGTALVLISAVIPWGVYTRYVLNSAASWPEPAAVLLTIWLTFFGAAACYRLGIHMAVTVGVDLLPTATRKACAFIVEMFMIVIAGFMVMYGVRLCVATWNNTI